MKRQDNQQNLVVRRTWRIALLAIPVLGSTYAVYWQLRGTEHSSEYVSTAIKGEPVALNQAEDIDVGFEGDVHPVLYGQKTLTLTAHWDKIANGDYESEMMPPEMCEYFLTLTPEIPRQEYTSKDFSAFLPDEISGVGQRWSIDSNRVVKFLKQFQRSASMNLVAQGRRVGPNGSYAVLRAKSAAYFDIAFRIHAEFDVTPIAWSAEMSEPDRVWYTPSYFLGQVIINRETGTVDYFHLALANEATLNVHLTVSHTHRTMDSHDIVRVDRMELVGGSEELSSTELAWEDSITYADAYSRLERVFYKFMAIDWVPFEETLSVAREAQRPVLAMVLWGNLDDQSC